MADYLVDTNILIYLVNPQAAQHISTLQAVQTLSDQGDVLCVAPQNIVEFWNVATRSVARSGLAWPVERAAAFFMLFVNNRLFRLLIEPASLLVTWYHLCVHHKVVDRRCFDAKLVALMNELGITHILTYNVTDFASFPNISVVNPDTI